MSIIISKNKKSKNHIDVENDDDKILSGDDSKIELNFINDVVVSDKNKQTINPNITNINPTSHVLAVLFNPECATAEITGKKHIKNIILVNSSSTIDCV